VEHFLILSNKKLSAVPMGDASSDAEFGPDELFQGLRLPERILGICALCQSPLQTAPGQMTPRTILHANHIILYCRNSFYIFQLHKPAPPCGIQLSQNKKYAILLEQAKV